MEEVNFVAILHFTNGTNDSTKTGGGFTSSQNCIVR